MYVLPAVRIVRRIIKKYYANQTIRQITTGTIFSFLKFADFDTAFSTCARALTVCQTRRRVPNHVYRFLFWPCTGWLQLLTNNIAHIDSFSIVLIYGENKWTTQVPRVFSPYIFIWPSRWQRNLEPYSELLTHGSRRFACTVSETIERQNENYFPLRKSYALCEERSAFLLW